MCIRDRKNDYVARVENIILDIQKNNSEFKNIYSVSGNVSEQSEDSEDYIGSVSLEYIELENRRHSKIILKEIMEKRFVCSRSFEFFPSLQQYFYCFATKINKF